MQFHSISRNLFNSDSWPPCLGTALTFSRNGSHTSAMVYVLCYIDHMIFMISDHHHSNTPVMEPAVPICDKSQLT